MFKKAWLLTADHGMEGKIPVAQANTTLQKELKTSKFVLKAPWGRYFM